MPNPHVVMQSVQQFPTPPEKSLCEAVTQKSCVLDSCEEVEDPAATNPP